MRVDVIVAVDVIAPVIVAVHVTGNAPVGVIDTVDDRGLTGTGQDIADTSP